jgi:hypothetical protein
MIQLAGRLVMGSPAQVVVVVERTRLSFAPEDVIRALPAQHPGESMLYLYRGAMLLSAEPADEGASSARRPFALCVRSRVTRTGPASRFHEIERRFLRAHGIIVDA